MSAWVVVPCLLALRDEFNAWHPNRSKGGDGTIGDSNHTSASDHTPDEDSDILRDHDADDKNEVHALDITGRPTDKGPDGRTYMQIFKAIIAAEKIKWLNPNDMCRLNYAIFDGYIYDKDNDFDPVKYHGSDQHATHMHFSARYETRAENDTRPWGVEGDDLVTTQAEFITLLTAALKDGGIRKLMTQAVLGTDGVIASPPVANSKNADGTPNTEWAGGSFLQNIYSAVVAARGYAQAAAEQSIDGPAIAATVLAGLTPELLGQAMTAAGLTPEAIAEAIPDEIADDVITALHNRTAPTA